MSLESLQVSITLPALPEHVYAAWLDAGVHGAMTGAAAEVDPVVGGRFTAWDGYIEGTTQVLEPTSRIVQTWRTADFTDDDPDSRLEIRFARDGAGTRVTLLHSDIPAGQAGRYATGWEEFYFTPMQAWFRGDRPG